MRKFIGYTLIGIGCFLLFYILYKNTDLPPVRRTYSSYTLLNSSWENYKRNFIADGRVVDRSQQNITTSEGQSYAMLRAVWIDDRPTFDAVWDFTYRNMKRPGDWLFGWKWGRFGNGENGVLDYNSASDADSDIAFALIFASRRWGDSRYLNSALAILNSIWNKETAVADGRRYLTAGNWAVTRNQIIINPSYFAPYAWRVFAYEDSGHDWMGLVRPAYDLLDRAGNAPLDTGSASGLPPEWVAVSSSNGQLEVAAVQNTTTNYSYNALRVPWRVALDYQWFKDPRARQYLTAHFRLLEKEYASSSHLGNVYSHSGREISSNESPSMYATSLSFLELSNPSLARRLYQEKIINLYSNDINGFDPELPYYEQNWLWFGAGLYTHRLIYIQPAKPPEYATANH